MKEEDEIDFTKLTTSEMKKLIETTAEEKVKYRQDRAEKDAGDMYDDFGKEETIKICEETIIDCNEAKIDSTYWKIIKEIVENK